MTSEKRVRDSFFEQAGYCEKLGSTFMRDLLNGLGKQLDKTTRTGKQTLEWGGEPEPKSDALALRLAGGLHALVRSGVDEVLLAFYNTPSRSSEAAFIPAVMEAIKTHDVELYPWLQFAPQTNEVARASAIYAGLSVVAEWFNIPLALYEMGCSGGLNLQCAQFGYTFKGEYFGDISSPLQLAPEWHGKLPPKTGFSVISRRGCDLNPLSVLELDDAAKLVAYLWPDQPARIARVEAAIEIARGDPPKLEKTDAAEWIEDMFQPDNGQGAVRVLYDTVAWNYFPQAVKGRIVKRMEEVGAGASPENPLAWLTFEFDDDDNGPFLKLRSWPGNGEIEVLASADPHVYGIKWLGDGIK